MITYGEPPRYVRFRVDRFSPHFPEDKAAFYNVTFPYEIWVDASPIGECGHGNPLYRVCPNSVWETRAAQYTGDREFLRSLSTSRVDTCTCQGELIEHRETVQ